LPDLIHLGPRGLFAEMKSRFLLPHWRDVLSHNVCAPETMKCA